MKRSMFRIANDPAISPLIMNVEGAEGIRHILVELHPHIIGKDKVAGIAGRRESDGLMVRERDRKTAYFERACQ